MWQLDPHHLVSLSHLHPVPERRPFLPAQKHHQQSVAEPACGGHHSAPGRQTPARSRQERESPKTSPQSPRAATQESRGSLVTRVT